MRVARKINDSMPEHMIDILESELRKNKKELSNAKVSILGLCYKKNIPDIRLSPALEIISILKEKTVDLQYVTLFTRNKKLELKLISVLLRMYLMIQMQFS